MSNFNCAYVRNHYGVPTEVGRRVIANGEPGVIMADRGHYIGVILDSDPKKRIRNYHPTWEMQYGDMAEELPLKQWEVLIDGMYDWDDVRYMLGDAHHCVRRVWAATRSQAKYRAYQELDECFEDATAMLTFKVRAAA
ncbi:hypothetical protein [Pseudomonas chlororaphis]|uniref:hypothetical protein n=1 Tax=Pseudomonas chlororaphis TaxID=587753 RepID=UPI0006A5FA0D|nr:hypothetical protein [Pseudomonas chlororaphis]AZD01345.1 hypothetical protein C4K27_2151 [Pseudomonas chlororaphis subsp. chlororaphis]MBM0285022.1 hypothetical protein [Pseudomonas chlororaphis]MDO1505695.1 hypothetical protein [Pseudomonas chlororaphis]ORM49836.1 hypothetical protein B6D51_01465 [Pseudomonas chlororaphis subsp. chlororaphis]TWR99114.1 hypothetical protein FJD36_03880 [Pseudomonas chlororaphis subsp. chlororaphis]